MAYARGSHRSTPRTVHRRPPGSPPQPPRLHRDGLGEHLRPQPVPPAHGRRARRLPPELHDHLRPVVPGGSRRPRAPGPDRDPPQPRPDGDPDRRHRVRRRDQEVRLHGDELPAARRGRPADALGGERRRGGRLGRLLRAVGHRQDDALGRSGAEPDRRRRARLGRRRRLQLRGRLLRQDDPPVADVRAGHLRDDAAASGRSSRTSTSTR